MTDKRATAWAAFLSRCSLSNRICLAEIFPGEELSRICLTFTFMAIKNSWVGKIVCWKSCFLDWKWASQPGKAESEAGGLPGTCVFYANWMDIIMIAYSVELICRVYGDEDPLHLPPALLTFLLPHFSLLAAAFLLSCFSSHRSSLFHPRVLVLSPRTPMTPRVFPSSPLTDTTHAGLGEVVVLLKHYI